MFADRYSWFLIANSDNGNLGHYFKKASMKIVESYNSKYVYIGIGI